MSPYVVAFGALAVVLAPITSAASEPCLAIEGATVYLPDGPQAGVTVITIGERITAVGGNVTVPEGCERHAGADRILTPGLVDVHTHLGLTEVDLEKASVDAQRDPKGQGTDRIRASFVVADAYNPHSTLIPISRIAGITSALTMPRGGLVSGQSAWVDLAGARQRDAVRSASAAMHVHIGGGEGSRADRLHSLATLLREGRLYRDRHGEWERRRYRDFALPETELRAVQPVLYGRIPLVVHVDRAATIEAVLRLLDKTPIRLVLMGGAEAWMHADELAAAKVAVVVDPLLNAPESFDRIAARADNAALLYRAGVPVILSTFWTHNIRTLAQVAGNAVRAGMDKDAAVAAITRVPAEVFGMAEHGRIAVGARANLVLWTGDPLELSSRPERVLIGGRTVPLVSRQTLLRDRYRTLPGSPSSPLSLP